MGMIGGGLGAFIGDVHRKAALLDGGVELVCGALSSTAEKSKSSGDALGLNPHRIYNSYEQMIRKEKELPKDMRMDFVSIVTPNHVHFGPSKMALENGFHVVCDKPLCMNLEEAMILKKLVESSGLVFCLTHNYTGYPMVKEARQYIKQGKLGEIRKVVVEYAQGWLSEKIEDGYQKQAAWRTNPAKSGIAGCMGDIGTHAENLVGYITGLAIDELAADLNIFVAGRALDDDGNVLLRFENGAKGILWASQIAAGEENELSIRVYGEKGALEWLQSDPNKLTLKWLKKPREVLKPGNDYLSYVAKTHTRIPAGHPEGYLESFANIYKNFALAVHAHIDDKKIDDAVEFPNIYDGIRGMRFIETVVESSCHNAAWMKMTNEQQD